MREINLKNTIDDLAWLRQTEALEALRDSLKASYDYACTALEPLHPPIVITPMKATANLPLKENTGYDKRWNIVDKFLFILKEQNRFIRFREVAKIIVEKDGEGYERDIADKLTSRTLPLKKEGKILKIQPDGSNINTFWGFKKWLDENGKVKQEHIYILEPSQRLSRTKWNSMLPEE
jgi:hypothetical protein